MIKRLMTLLFPKNTEWRPYVVAGRLVMGRKVNGAWEYREPTFEESNDYQRREAW